VITRALCLEVYVISMVRSSPSSAERLEFGNRFAPSFLVSVFPLTRVAAEDNMPSCRRLPIQPRPSRPCICPCPKRSEDLECFEQVGSGAASPDMAAQRGHICNAAVAIGPKTAGSHAWCEVTVVSQTVFVVADEILMFHQAGVFKIPSASSIDFRASAGVGSRSLIGVARSSRLLPS
jgi:hypothetical protein